MTIAARVGLHYVAAACVGICFGVLLGGAVIFVTTTDTASAIEWMRGLPAPITLN